MGALGSLLATLLRANSRNFVCRTRFSSIWAPFGYENQRNSDENLRNHCENLRPAPRIKRRIPTRVRRSREANSIRRTLRLRRERSVLNNASYSRTPSELGELASPYPSTGLRESAVPPQSGEFLPPPVNFFCFWPPKSPPWPLLGSVRRLQHRSWAFLARFFTKHRSERAPKSNFKRS